MKRKYIILLIILSLPLLDVFYACCNCNYDTTEKLYTNADFSLKNIDYSGEKPEETLADSINKNAYGIRLQVERQSLTLNKRRNVQSLFTPSAYAFSCDCPPTVTYDPTDIIHSIQIITIEDFNDEKPANTDVTEYFRTAEMYLEIDEIIWDLNRHFAEYFLKIENFDLLLMVQPSESNVQHQFKVIITFENKSPIELETTTVDLI